MEMEGEKGTAVKSKAAMTTPSPPLEPGQRAAGTDSASSLASRAGSGTSASGKQEGDDDSRQGKVTRPEEGDDGVVWAEAGDDGEGANPPPTEDGDDDDEGWSTVSEDDSIDGDDDNEGWSTVSEDDSIDGDETGELHPMKNPVILKRMFDLCPRPLLAKFRLVCMDWRDLSMEAWRSSVTLYFIHNRGKVGLRHVVRDDGNHMHYEDVPLKEFLEHVEDPNNQCQRVPFRRYDLTGDSFKFPLEESKSPRTRKLWELVKRDATALELYGCLFPSLEGFREVIYRALPNLRELKLHCCRVGEYPPHRLLFPFVPDWDVFFQNWYMDKQPIPRGIYPEHLHLKSLSILLEDNLGKFPLTWLELFSQFPRLSRLSLGIDMPDEEPEDEPFVINALLLVLEAIKAVRERDPRNLPLKEFEILPDFESSIEHKHFRRVFSLLLELRLPLQSSLRLSCKESRRGRKLFELPVQIDGSRLQSLFLYQAGTGISTWKFPFQERPLENLSVLMMGDILWENMEFLRFTPTLEKLAIFDSSFLGRDFGVSGSVGMISKTRKGLMASVKLLKMKEFIWPYTLTEDDIHQLVDWFPNLTSLHAALDDKLFALVCEHWRDLEFLTVRGTELTDGGVTGLGEGQVVGDLDRMELPPNIRLLQNLTGFKYPIGRELTDVSVVNGFLKLPHLRSLTLGETGAKRLSEKAMAALKAKLI